MRQHHNLNEHAVRRAVHGSIRLSLRGEQGPFGGSSRCGFTLAELLIGMTITATLSIVLAGLMMAVQTARQHVTGLEEATLQSQAVMDRVRFMVSHSGVYQAAGGRTTVGLGVVRHHWLQFDLPDTLVVWSGGRAGGMAEQGTQPRLPRANELIVYTVEPGDSARLVETAFPHVTAEVDFQDPGFEQQILSLIKSPEAEHVLLCNSVRVAHLSAGVESTDARIGNLRFEIEQTPSDEELQDAESGNSDPSELTWAQGISNGSGGLRQATVRVELQIDVRTDRNDPGSALNATPFFGSAARRYNYLLQ